MLRACWPILVAPCIVLCSEHVGKRPMLLGALLDAPSIINDEARTVIHWLLGASLHMQNLSIYGTSKLPGTANSECMLLTIHSNDRFWNVRACSRLPVIASPSMLLNNSTGFFNATENCSEYPLLVLLWIYSFLQLRACAVKPVLLSEHAQGYIFNRLGACVELPKLVH